MSDSPRPAPVSFSEFEPLTTAAWQQRIQRDLKGADLADLQWTTPDGLTLQPFYHREALAALGGAPAPQVRPPHRGAPNAWRNLPALLVEPGQDGRAAIDHAARALQGGADGAHFDIAGADRFDLGYLAATLPLTQGVWGFTVSRQPEQFLGQLLAATGKTPLRGFLRYSPGPGTLPDDYAMQTQAMLRCLQLTRHLPEFFPLAVNGAFFGNRGATPVQQLAYSLSIAASFLDNLTAHDLDLDTTAVASAIHFHVSIGPSYFTEIAKLRALRRLWATVLHAFGVRPEVAATLRIHATTSSWTQTTLDPHTNMLRVTTEAMSAVLGGADSISVTPYDSLYAEPNEFSARIARNVPVILREEAYLDRVADPAAGSYFIETLTDQLAREAWALFQQTEAGGGFLVTRGKVMESIRLATMEQFRRIATNEQVIVGTNLFQNLKEQFGFDPKKLLRSRQFDTARAAYPSEVLRLATAMHFIRKEQKKKKAAVVLLGTDTIQQIYQSFVRLLPVADRPAMSELPAQGALSLLFSSAEEATLMSAQPEQFQQFADFIRNRPDDSEEDTVQMQYDAPILLACDLPTMQDAVKYFGFKEFTVSGYSTDDVLARLQGR
ncbi:methylmalonyl-CoA mutase [Hymenobacter gummosus]|uniref:Methylmalonyl-CoA mutase n=1 Tax=Hymenobacter gummosus TaxID=1776032 RepID=A0A431U411_9BACT|nr:methylmalonyl-CoA mutase family protein [Hymenobacter gummosus]RTQ50155.1 methylmalonyl-CoA mutase [Hymenobacter gummosus]